MGGEQRHGVAIGPLQQRPVLRRGDGGHPPCIPGRVGIADLRNEYETAGLDQADLAPRPLDQWQRWYDDAVAAGCTEPNAMTLATVDAAGRPDARYVLVRGVDERGLWFFTNTESVKGDQLAAHPVAARGVRLAGAAPPGAPARAGRGPGSIGRGGVLRQPAALEPAGVVGVAAVDGAARSGDAPRRIDGGRGPVPGRRRAGAPVGRVLPGRARRGRVLAGSGRAPARPAALPARRGGMAGRSPVAVAPAAALRRRLAPLGQSLTPVVRRRTAAARR